MFYATSSILLWSSPLPPRGLSLVSEKILKTFLFLALNLWVFLLCEPFWHSKKYLEHKLVAALLNRSAHAVATSCALALHWLEAFAPHADLISSKQWYFSLWQFNSLDILQKSKFIVPSFQIYVNFFFFFLFTIVMSFVGELLNTNIKKEMSEEVKDFKADVSNIFNLNLNMGATQEDRMTWNSIRMDMLRYLMVVQVAEVWITKDCWKKCSWGTQWQLANWHQSQSMSVIRLKIMVVELCWLNYAGQINW